MTGMTIVNTNDGSLTHNMTIVMQGGKIVNVSPTNALVTSGTTVVATGGYVVPGFNDMHAHPLTWPDIPAALNTMIAYGITGFRQMSGSAAMLAARANGTLMQPSQPALLQIPSDILTPANAVSASVATALVDAQIAQGADFIKVVGITGAPFNAAVAEAKARGKELTGHLSPTDDVRLVTAAGMTGIEHMGPRDSVLIGCSTQEAAIRASITPLPPGGPGLADPNFATDMIALPTLYTNPVEIARYKTVMNTFSTAQMQDLAGHLVANRTTFVPTLTRLRTMSIPLDPAYMNDPNLQYVPAGLLTVWKQLAALFAQDVSVTNQTILSQLYTALAGLVRPFKTAGVTMLAGSDAGGEWCIPGPSLHQEFDQLALAGLTPLEILQMTTIDAAAYLGTTSTMGTVAVGQNADLVVLSADPTQSAQNLHGITGVVRSGTYMSATQLNGLKSAAVKRIADVPFEVGRNSRCSCCAA